jgi:hypothetical protein
MLIIKLPKGIPHRCSSDDEYDGYFIPKGTLVIGNSWHVTSFFPGTLSTDQQYRTILHDPEVYPNPEKYDPERWLKDGKLNPAIQDSSTAAFGFGRR